MPYLAMYLALGNFKKMKWIHSEYVKGRMRDAEFRRVFHEFAK